MSKLKLSTITIITALALAGCGSESMDGEITSSGSDAGVRLHAWCDDDSAVTMGVEYGGPGNQRTVMVSPALAGSGIFDAVDEFERSYGLAEHEDAELNVDVLPTDGTCHVSLTDRVGGEVLERSFNEDDDDFVLTALVTRGVS